MNDFGEIPEPNKVNVLDENYLYHWEQSVGVEMMPAFLADLVKTFEENYQQQTTELIDACQRGDCEKLISLTHYIKGGLGNLGLSRASAFARQAEVELRTNSFKRFESFSCKLDDYINEGLDALLARYR